MQETSATAINGDHHFLDRNPDITVLNVEKLRKGSITRSRIVNGTEEKSIIDFMLICK